MSLAVVAAKSPMAAAFEIPLTRTQRAQKLVEEGQGQIARGEFQLAVESCTRALSIRADWAPAYLCRSEARVMTKDDQAAKDAWQAARLDPRSGAPFRVLGILDYRDGRYASAIKNFKEALLHSKLKPEDVSDVHYYRAQIELNQGLFSKALDDANRGLGIVLGLNGDFGNWSFHSLRAEIYRRQNQQDKADHDEREVVRMISDRLARRPEERADLLAKRAESYSLLREYGLAAKDYGEMLTSDGSNVDLRMSRAFAYFNDGQFEPCIKDLDEALRLDSRHAPALRLRALARVSLGDTAGAVGDLDAYLDLEPNDASALADRGIAKKFLEDYRGSLRDLSRAQALQPDNAAALWGHKSFVQEMLGDHESALESAEKALKDDPNDFSAHLAKARAAMILGQYEPAETALDWLIGRAPSSAYYLWLRGESRCGMGKQGPCLEDLKAAAAADPRSPLIAERLAFHYHRILTDASERPSIGQLRQARRYYDTAKALGPLSLESRVDLIGTMVSLAGQLMRGGSTREARRLIRQAAAECDAILKANPRNKAARRLRKSMGPVK